MTLDLDWRLRLAAFAELGLIRERNRGSDLITSSQISAGFHFEGEQIMFLPSRQGIWRPRQLGRDGAALAIRTSPPIPGRPAPYDDQLDEESGFFTYKYQGRDPHQWDNVAVRRAMEVGRPLIYFLGFERGIYRALYPAYVVADSPASLEFRVQIDADIRVVDPVHSTVAERAIAREYVMRLVKQRLHQDRFRQVVMRAYQTRCAVCRLRHPLLLDAAHIIADSNLRGLPEVTNGLALCKIHHSAYDENILGIDPEYRVHVNREVLEERDGPMLEHGLKGMDGARLWVPRRELEQPNREYLAERFERWQVA